MTSFSKFKTILTRPGVGRRFALYIVLFSSLITLISTALQLSIDFQQDVANISNQLNQVTSSYADSLANSLWVTSKEDVELQLAGIARLPDMQYIEIRSDQNKVIAKVGTPQTNHIISQQSELFYKYRGKQIHVGKLVMLATLNGAYQRIKNKIILILVIQTIKTFLVSLFILYLFYQLVGRHLHRLALFGEQLETDSTDQIFQLDRRMRSQNRLDELDLLVHSLNRLNGRISTSYRELEESEYRWKYALEGAGDGVWDWDCQTNQVFYSSRYMTMLGYEDDVKWTSFADWKSHCHPDDLTKVMNALRAYLNGESKSFSTEHRGLCKDGSWKWLSARGMVVSMNTSNNIPLRMIGSSSDITERKLHEAQINFLANHDSLTELPNRILAKLLFTQAMAFADRNDGKAALIYLDLDNFKSINDTLGHTAGDKLLKSVSATLLGCVRAVDTISRQGGDEFVIILMGIQTNDDINLVADKILKQIAQPISIDDQDLSISSSMGISVYPDDGNDFETLMKKSDVAMYKAKEAGKNTYRFYTNKMNEDAHERLSIRNGLQKAIENQEFVLYYQPQIHLNSGRVIGAEALIRWKHPEQGIIAPGRFISVAEESGLIVPIGDWVLQEACNQISKWVQAGWRECVIAVNLSEVQFRRSDIEQTVKNAINKAGITPASLELELTESILIQDTENVLNVLQRLKILGICLSIDDFGTGYSSLSYLKRFAVDKLKIDQSFVRDMQHDPNDAAIVKAIIQMAQSLNLKTIAEGVETENMINLLQQLHCDEVQGYFYAKPMPAEEFLRYLDKTDILR